MNYFLRYWTTLVLNLRGPFLSSFRTRILCSLSFNSSFPLVNDVSLFSFLSFSELWIWTPSLFFTSLKPLHLSRCFCQNAFGSIKVLIPPTVTGCVFSPHTLPNLLWEGLHCSAISTNDLNNLKTHVLGITSCPITYYGSTPQSVWMWIKGKQRCSTEILEFSQ